MQRVVALRHARECVDQQIAAFLHMYSAEKEHDAFAACARHGL